VLIRLLSRTRRVATLAAIVLSGALVCVGVSVRADEERVEPLEVPRGLGPAPEQHPDLAPQARIELGLASRMERGYPERPMLAWSLIRESQRVSNPALASRAVEVASNTPMIVFEAFLAGASGATPLDLVRSFRSNLPALVWLGGLICLGLLLAALASLTIAASVGMARTLTLHGHAISHQLPGESTPSWLGPLALVALLSVLPLFGFGPLLCVASMATLAIVRSSAPQGAWLVGLLVAAGLAIGPGLDYTARILTQPLAQPQLAAAWRGEKREPLPLDAAYLEAAARADRASDDAADSDAAQLVDPIATYAWGSSLKHQGRLDEAERVLRERGAADRQLESRSSNLLGILHLARGDVSSALSEFERARAVSESATVLYNLSQTYARSVELLKRESLYAAARDLDPDLVSQYASLEGANVHRYVIQEPLPLGLYLARVFDDTPQARAWVADMRARALGAWVPGIGWLLLPLLGGVGWALRRENLSRCRRCDRPVCRACMPPGGGAACARCERLFSARARIDARVRKQQAELDRKQQNRLRWLRCVWSALFPGIGAWRHGNAWFGGTRLVLGALALGGLAASWLTPVPFEVGSAARVPVWGFAGLLGVLYAIEVVGIQRELARKVKT